MAAPASELGWVVHFAPVVRFNPHFPLIANNSKKKTKDAHNDQPVRYRNSSSGNQSSFIKKLNSIDIYFVTFYKLIASWTV